MTRIELGLWLRLGLGLGLAGAYTPSGARNNPGSSMDVQISIVAQLLRLGLAKDRVRQGRGLGQGLRIELGKDYN